MGLSHQSSFPATSLTFKFDDLVAVAQLDVAASARVSLDSLAAFDSDSGIAFFKAVSGVYRPLSIALGQDLRRPPTDDRLRGYLIDVGTASDVERIKSVAMKGLVDYNTSCAFPRAHGAETSKYFDALATKANGLASGTPSSGQSRGQKRNRRLAAESRMRMAVDRERHRYEISKLHPELTEQMQRAARRDIQELERRHRVDAERSQRENTGILVHAGKISAPFSAKPFRHSVVPIVSSSLFLPLLTLWTTASTLLQVSPPSRTRTMTLLRVLPPLGWDHGLDAAASAATISNSHPNTAESVAPSSDHGLENSEK